MLFYDYSNYVVKKEQNKDIIMILAPGIDEKNIEVKYEDGRINISINEDNDFITKNYYSFVINENKYDIENFEAKLEKGILKIELPYTRDKLARKIEVKSIE